MGLPDSALSKGIRNPKNALLWLRNVALEKYEERVFTPMKARFLFDEDWDVAVILDGCRYDTALECVRSHPVELGSPEAVWSAGSWSPDWISRTFRSAPDDILERTAYITANVFTDKLPKSTVGHLDAVWQYAWDDTVETVPPRPVTDRAITTIRDDKFDRYLIHYMQPHLPPVTDHSEFPGFDPVEGDPKHGQERSQWAPVRDGEIAPEVGRTVYRENLDAVLDDIDLLQDNIDAEKMIITADHGNYLGERGRWGHPEGHMHRAVRQVPWWESSATDRNTYTPTEYDTTADEADREQRLEALGYL